MQNFHGLQYRTHIIFCALLQRRAKVSGYSHLILPTVNYSSYYYYSYECYDYYDTLIGPSPQYLTILAFYNSCFTQMRARFLESESDAEQVDFLSAYPAERTPTIILFLVLVVSWRFAKVRPPLSSYILFILAFF